MSKRHKVKIPDHARPRDIYAEDIRIIDYNKRVAQATEIKGRKPE